jgi:hypothetical protein
MNEKLVKLMSKRLNEALERAQEFHGSLSYAASYANAACAFNAFLNLLPDLTYDEKTQKEMELELRILRDRARSWQLHDFGMWVEDVRAELVGERERRIRNHW